MKIQDFLTDNGSLTNLLEDEMVSIQGGESAWYWVAYGTGTAYHYIKIAASMDESIPIG